MASATYVTVFISIGMGLLSMLTTLGNCLVFYVYSKSPGLQIPTNYLILSLAFADFLIGVFSINFYTVYLVHQEWQMPVSVCELWLCLDYWVSQASVVSLLSISIDRYLLLKHPIKYKNVRTPNKVKALIACIWLVTFVEWVPLILVFNLTGENRNSTICEAKFLTRDRHASILSAIFAYYIPVILLAVICKQIYNMLRERKSRIEGKTVSGSTNKMINLYGVKTTEDTVFANNKREERLGIVNKRKETKKYIRDHKRASKLLLVIVVAFVLTWLPYHIQAVMKTFTDNIPEWAWHVGYILCYANSTINPPCYAYGNKTFKRRFKELFFKRPTKIQDESSE